ncbi:MAG: zinc ribbon domain-containing protein [Calditrichia bacterium]
MPNYYFKCNDCQKTFSVRRSVEEMVKLPPPPCVHCGGKNVQRLYSGISVVTSKKS